MSYVLQLVDSSIRTFNDSKHMVSYKFNVNSCMHVHGWNCLLILFVIVLAVIASVIISVLFPDLSLMQYSYVLMMRKSKYVKAIVDIVTYR